MLLRDADRFRRISRCLTIALPFCFFVLWLVPVCPGQSESAKELIGQLHDPDPNVRVLAAKAMGEIGGPSTVGPLIVALNDKDWRVRLSAVNALGDCKDPRAVKPLKAALNDTDSFVRQGAADALEKLPNAAYSRANGTSSSASSNSLTGCLFKAGDGYKVRNAKYPKGVEVSLPSGYEGDAGYTVTLSGNWGVNPKSGEYGTISVGAGGQATMTNVDRVFTVSGVTDIARSCALATGASAKATPGGDRVAPPMRATISPEIAANMLLEKTNPMYPPIAKAARVSGTVVLRAVISKDGKIEDLRVISGPVMLHEAALDAVRTWRYRPHLISKRPVEVESTVNVVFALGE